MAVAHAKSPRAIDGFPANFTGTDLSLLGDRSVPPALCSRPLGSLLRARRRRAAAAIRSRAMSESSSHSHCGVAALARGESSSRAPPCRAPRRTRRSTSWRGTIWLVVERLRGELSTAWTHADAAVEFCAPDARAFPVVCSHRALPHCLMERRRSRTKGSSRGFAATLRIGSRSRIKGCSRGSTGRSTSLSIAGARRCATARGRACLRSCARGSKG